MTPEQALVESWKQTIAVQMHFNDLELRIRSYALTVVAAIIAASGLSGDSPNVVLYYSAPIVWVAFFLMDRFWYHPLLEGAVSHGLDLERQAQTVGYSLQIGATPEPSALGLTHRIKAASQGPLGLRSTAKMFTFYLLVFVALIAVPLL